jgi:hypothetical protein
MNAAVEKRRLRLIRQRIEDLWDLGIDTFEIAKRLGLDEFRVCPIVSAYVTAKKFRKSAF